VKSAINGVKDNLEKVGKRKTSVISLSTLKEKQAGTIAFIRGEKKVLRKLMDMGLTPGTRISVSRVAPMKGPLESHCAAAGWRWVRT